MPMDRPGPNRTWIRWLACLALTSAGCRHTRPEVPPERPYLNPGGGAAASSPRVGFSTEPPAHGNALGTAMSTAPSLPGSAAGYGTAPGTAPIPQPDPLENLPGPPSSVPPGTNLPPQGRMGIGNAPPSPL